jgi:hypothetical protein
VYVIRDVLTSDGQFAGFCQYKTQRHDGSIVWKPCAEGVQFSAIEPFESDLPGEARRG